MRRMDNRYDFMQWLGPDMSIKILTHLDDPSDLVRACSVSISWQRFIIEHGLCKQLYLKFFPEISSARHVSEVENMIEPVNFSFGDSPEWERLKRNHRVYAFLAQGLARFMKKDCISEPISASSTDNYPDESIVNTLTPYYRVDNRALYWSSEGDSDPSVPEILMYKLVSQLCVVTEIHVQPFQAYFQYGLPIYSSKAVRFRMGYPRNPLELDNGMREILLSSHNWEYDDFEWTYTSPEFPVAQENCLQKFKLPEAVLCIGGILQVELLGRVQRQEMDELYYICVSHVQVVGRPLSSQFDIEINNSSGKCTLKYNPETQSPEGEGEGEGDTPSRLRTFTTRLLQLLGNGPVVGNNDEEHPPNV
ncbi:F-box protein At4g00755-like [Fagus crenata]